ncbi:MAG: RNase adapter RapZ [Pseudomonadota bacterium]
MPRFVFVTGLSGAGKSTAMHALEDLQFWSVDNLPLPLLEKLLELAQRAGGALQRLAAVCDVRDPALVPMLPTLVDALRMRGYGVDLLFLEADDAELDHRFAGTGRPHPLVDGVTDLAAALVRERQVLAPLRERASVVIDTTHLNVHELRRAIRRALGVTTDDALAIDVVPFAYGDGLPAEASVLIDVRALPGSIEDVGALAGRLAGLLGFLHPRAQREGRAYLSVGIGNADGQGSALQLARTLVQELRAGSVPVRIRELEPGGGLAPQATDG